MADATWVANTHGKSVATLVSATELRVVDDPAGTPASKKTTAGGILAWIIAQANTWTATQTITPAANTSALVSTGYSLTGSNAQSLIDLAGTWNTSGTPTAFKVNITNTASNAASMLADFQIGGVSQFKVQADGYAIAPYLRATGGFIEFSSSNYLRGFSNSINAAQELGSASSIGLSSTVSLAIDVKLFRDAANILAQRNGTNAQTQRWYGTYTDTSNYRRVAITMSTAGVAAITPEGLGTGHQY